MEQECLEKASKYIENVKNALATLHSQASEKVVESVVEQARLYLSDAQHYLNLGECLTSIACSSYAEGLLDALRMLGKVDFQWRAARSHASEKRVLVGGVFDIIHPGHIYFLRKAAGYGKVYVVVARDATVRETKGRDPLMNESERVMILNSLKLVEEAFLGDYPPNFSQAIEKVKPDFIALGADQAWLKPQVEEALLKTGVPAKIIFIEERIGDYSSTKYRNNLGKGLP